MESTTKSRHQYLQNISKYEQKTADLIENACWKTIEFLENTLLTLFFVFIFIVCQCNIALTRIYNTVYLHVFLAIPTRKTKRCYNCVFCPKSSRVQNKAQTLSNTYKNHTF